MEIQGKYNKAIIYTDEVDSDAISQIYSMLNLPAFKNTEIRIMPDVHMGKGSVVGFTMVLNDFVSPNVIGVDIGCGVNAHCLGQISFDLRNFDNFVHKHIPSGRDTADSMVKDYFKPSADLISLIERVAVKHYHHILKSAGTLGGGNHFIEIGKDTDSNYWLFIHSGSRYLGLAVHDYHQIKAKQYMRKIFKGAGAFHGSEYLPVKGEGEAYIADMKITQQFAQDNRDVMARILIEKFFGLKFKECNAIRSVHNYIDFKDNIVRKGAIAAHAGTQLIIPLNMRDGVLLCEGKGNIDWNYSAPHGAGRIYSRALAKEKIKLNDFKNTMKDIYSSCITESTIDESPMAYKSAAFIESSIRDTVNVLLRITPVYNYKAT